MSPRVLLQNGADALLLQDGSTLLIQHTSAISPDKVGPTGRVFSPEIPQVKRLLRQNGADILLLQDGDALLLQDSFQVKIQPDKIGPTGNVFNIGFGVEGSISPDKVGPTGRVFDVEIRRILDVDRIGPTGRVFEHTFSVPFFPDSIGPTGRVFDVGGFAQVFTPAKIGPTGRVFTLRLDIGRPIGPAINSAYSLILTGSPDSLEDLDLSNRFVSFSARKRSGDPTWSYRGSTRTRQNPPNCG